MIILNYGILLHIYNNEGMYVLICHRSYEIALTKIKRKVERINKTITFREKLRNFHSV